MNRLQQISRWALLLYIVLSMSWLGAQNAAQIDVLTTDDGLLFRDVSNIAQDSKGLMWFGTTQGLNRYDGNSFKAYNSDKNNPYFIDEDFIKANMVYDSIENSIWYMANDKLFQKQLSTDLVLTYNKNHNLKDRVLDVLKAADHSIWVITDNYWESKKDNSKLYLQKFENEQFSVVASVSRYKKGFSNVAIDNDGYIWWTTARGTNKYAPNGTLIDSVQLDTYNWFGDYIHFIPSFFDRNNTHYYFPKSKGGIVVFDARTNTHKTILNTDDIIRQAIEDKNKNIWFSGNSSLYKMDEKGTFTDYTTLLKETFDFSIINNLYIDNIGLLWGATDNGLFKIDTRKETFTNLFKSNNEGWGHSMRGIFEAFDGRIFSLCESKHQLWFTNTATVKDSFPLKDASGKHVPILYDASFIVPNKDKTKAYTTGNGITEIDLKTGITTTFEAFKQHNNVNGPNGIIMLDDGRLLFGYTMEYLTLFDPNTKESQPVFNLKPNQKNIRDIRVFAHSSDKNCVWIGTRNDGVLKININGNVTTSYNHNTISGFGKYQILSLLDDDDGSLWIGSYGGGLKHISANGQIKASYTTDDGLPNNNVVGVLKTDENKILISTYNGLSLLDLNAGEFQNFYVQDGLSHNEFNFSSFLKDSKGQYYFGGMNGINTFNAKAIEQTSQAPEMQFMGISGYNSRDKDFFKLDYSQKPPAKLHVSPYDQYIEISWVMPSYFQNNKNTFNTKLEGFEDRWFYQGNNASIRYNKLPAGDYVLKVEGMDARGNKSASVLSIPITVKQIFYKRWWFMALVLLIIATVIYAIFKYRLQQVLAMERLRTKISSDLHDDVGSMLSGLAMQTELLEANANSTDKSKLQKIANISRNAISQMRDLVWSIDSRRQTTKDLMERIQELAEELLLPKDILFKIENEAIKFPNKKLAPQTKQNIFLIVKEALTNIIRHSNATEVTIDIKHQNQGSCITICDNGTTKATTSTGLGLSNMNMRAEQIKGRLTITNCSGFCITLQLQFYL